MKKVLLAGLAIGLIGLSMAPSNSSASILKFTATSTASGELGYLEYDSSSFDGTAFQFIDNTHLLSIDFASAGSSFHVVTPGPSSEGTWFDSTGMLPTVVGGSGFTGGTNSDDGVWIADSYYVEIGLGQNMGSQSYRDVHWTPDYAGSQPVPEPATMLLMGTGIAGLIAARRKKKA